MPLGLLLSPEDSIFNAEITLQSPQVLWYFPSTAEVMQLWKC